MAEFPNKDDLLKKWKPVLDVEGVAPITDKHKRWTTAVVLENQEIEFKKANSIYGRNGQTPMTLSEAAPTNSTGSNIDNYDPVLISLLRRTMPNMLPYDLCGVQPMTGPTGLIFCLKATYTSQSGSEALFSEANTFFSGTNAAGGNGVNSGSSSNTDPVLDLNDSTVYGVGRGMTTANAEALGTGSSSTYFPEMAFTIDKITADVKSRALKAEYSIEMAQDLKAVHGLDAETELSNILSSEILAEINREIVRIIYRCAKVGAQTGTASAGTFNLDSDSNGRWLGEKFKGMYFQFEREANFLAKETRRGKGNIALVSSDVASALSMAGVLDYTPAINNQNLNVDDTGNLFAGTMFGGRMKVYVDPYFYSASGYEVAVVGYKGSSPFDAGLFYCPYVPLQLLRATDSQSFQPKIGFKTRYGLVANPFATAAGDGVVGDRNTSNQANKYYRIFRITNLM